MFGTSTDWEFDDMDAAEAMAEKMWPTLKSAGALTFRFIKTGDNTVRSFITWPDAATAQASIDKMRAKALDQVRGKVVKATAGELMTDYG